MTRYGFLRRYAPTLVGIAGVLATAMVGTAAGPRPTAAPTPDHTRPASSMSFTNPIDDLGNDPFVVKDGHHYYYVQSWNGGIWITESPTDDLTDLAKGHRVKVWTYPTSGPNCSAVWAPELHLIDGHWYVYYAATTCDGVNANHRMFALRSATADPLSAYSDAGEVADATNTWAIDGTTFSYAGRRYFVWSGWPTTPNPTDQQNLYIAAMSGPTTVVGSRVLLSEPTYAWERVLKPHDEGPEALQHNGRLFLVYSASSAQTDDYAYGMLSFTGGDPLDPADWTKSPTPVFSRTATVFGPGHGSFVTSPDGREDWMVYHSARSSGSGQDRVIDVQRFGWNADGSPRFGRPVDPFSPQRVPSGQTTCYRCVVATGNDRPAR